jgi:ParB family chromosome partitioning protein
MAGDEIEYLSLNLVDRPKDPIRTSIDPEKVRELAESIREVGLQEPVIVRVIDGRYEVVAGDRRYLAHKLLGEGKLKCIVKSLTDEEVAIIRATENIQREDLSPMDKARAYKMMTEIPGYNVQRVARRMGVRIETVYKYLHLLELEPEFQEAVDKGKLTIVVAEVLRRIDDPEFRRYYLKAATENGVTEGVATQWLRDYEQSKAGKFADDAVGGVLSGSPSDGKPIYITCELCRGPEESRKVRYIGICESCVNEIIRARGGGLVGSGDFGSR